MDYQLIKTQLKRNTMLIGSQFYDTGLIPDDHPRPSVRVPPMSSAARRVSDGRKDNEGVSLNRLLANHLLAALPVDDFDRLLPHLTAIRLSGGRILHEMETNTPFAYLPTTAVVSHLYILADGSTAEAAMIGNDGLSGLATIFDGDELHYCTRVLVGGDALRIRKVILKEQVGRAPAFRRTLLSYARARMTQLSQRAVCNGHHSVEQRLCCWLLMVQDRTSRNQLPLTHEVMATHLGVRRSGITECANALRDSEIISYYRGVVTIRDRNRLETAACECYPILRQNTKNA